jgi:hypothetical protein
MATPGEGKPPPREGATGPGGGVKRFMGLVHSAGLIDAQRSAAPVERSR